MQNATDSADASDAPATSGATPARISETSYHEARERVVANFECDYLSDLLERAEGNRSEAARLAQVDRTTLYRLLQRHGIPRTRIRRTANGR